MTTAVIIVLIIGALALIALVRLLSWRSRAYSRLLKFDPAQDYTMPAFGECVEIIALRCTDEGFSLPSFAADAVSGFLELMVESTLPGWLNEPRVEMNAGSFKNAQYFERGACGYRFLNVSRLLSHGIKTKQHVTLRGQGLKWRSGWVRLYLCREQLNTKDHIVVIAPHPDDAEIAAFGLYSEAHATVVTVTAGDDSDRFDKQPGVPFPLPRDVVARLRVWDSIFIPTFGGVSAERAVNLCYPDGQLAEMHADSKGEFNSRKGTHVDYPALRQLNASSLLDSAAHRCSWESLVKDLTAIFSELQPGIIVAPLPVVDPNPDHGLTTLAVCEALRICGMNTARLFLYIVHNRWTELYPFGPAGSGVSLPPGFEAELIECDSFYSHSLSLEQQMWKGLALQAMHDLQEFTPPELPNGRFEWRRLKAALGAKIKGLSNPPTSYLRRAVRTDELFFVLNLEQAEHLALIHAQQMERAYQ